MDIENMNNDNQYQNEHSHENSHESFTNPEGGIKSFAKSNYQFSSNVEN